MQKVDNPVSLELTEAVKAFLGDKNQETYEKAVRAVLEAKKQERSVYVPVRQATVGSKDGYIVPSTLSASNGKWYYIFYTSERDVPRVTEEGLTYMPIAKILGLAGHTHGCGGICVDPWDRDGMFIPAEYLSTVAD